MEEMKAGRDLDVIVHEKVFNEKADRSLMSDGPRYFDPPDYSTNIASAFDVVQKVLKDYRSKISIETYDGIIWSIKPCGTSSNSLPHAICIAALKAVAK